MADKLEKFEKKYRKNLPKACYTVGGVYALAGTLKLCKINDDVHKAIKKAFKEYAKVFILAPIGLKPDHKMLRHVVGAAELFCGGMLIFGKNKNKRRGVVGLAIIMALRTQAKLCMGDYLEALVPAICGLSLVGLYGALKEQDIHDKKYDGDH